MKKIIALILAVVLGLSLSACGQNKTGLEHTTEAPAASEEPTTASESPEEPTPNYAEAVPAALHGVWVDGQADNILEFYAFKDDRVQVDLVNMGIAGTEGAFSGTFTVKDDKVRYDYGGVTGYSYFTYDNGVLTLSNAKRDEIKKVTATDLMAYLLQEESSNNTKGVLCLADLILNYYPDSEECGVAGEKKEAASAAINAEGEAALQALNTTYDKVQKLTWYQHKSEPKYTDECCYIYPYFGRSDDGNMWLRVQLNYTDAQTDFGWVFFDQVTFSVDGENTIKQFSRSDIVRDNDTEVWETADFEPDATEVVLLRDIANSTETIIRFEGDEYYQDHVVTEKEKKAILDVLTAYDYLNFYSEEGR